MAGGAAQTHVAYSARPLAASAANTVTANLAAARFSVPPNGFIFVLDHTVDESTVLDTCDVYVQTMLDGTRAAGNWTDVVHFAQHLGNQGAERRIAKVLAAGVMLEFDQTTLLAAGAVRHALGDNWRVRVEITDNSGAAAFTFSVMAIPV